MHNIALYKFPILFYSILFYSILFWQQKTKCIWDGHVQKDNVNQSDKTQNQLVYIRGAEADMSFPDRSQKKKATILRPCSASWQSVHTCSTWHRCWRQTSRKTTETLDRWHQTMDRNTCHCRLCSTYGTRDRSAWRSLMSESVTSDPQIWGSTKGRQGNNKFLKIIIIVSLTVLLLLAHKSGLYHVPLQSYRRHSCCLTTARVEEFQHGTLEQLYGQSVWNLHKLRFAALWLTFNKVVCFRTAISSQYNFKSIVILLKFRRNNLLSIF